MSYPVSEFPNPQPDQPFSLRARWVFPVWGPPPLENGLVEITAGRISAVHDRPGPCTIDLGNAAIIPGLVNAHTHLELSDLAAPLHPNLPFTAWLKAVMAHRRTRAHTGTAALSSSDDAFEKQIVEQGRRESARWGTTLIGDITGAGSSLSVAGTDGPRLVTFLEVLGLAPERVASQLDRARAHLAEPHGLSRGLSPHAPYSVHPDLVGGLVDLAVSRRAPVAMHLAETRAELELLADGTGEFLPFLEGVGVWRADAILRGTRPLDYLRELARAENALAIHGNYFAADEVDFLAIHPNISVVYCPRTHAFFRHEPHPWRELLKRHVNVALGTDSRASSPDLGLWNELLFLRAHFPDFDPSLLLRLGTWNGAFALGLESESGSLAVGKAADLAVVELAAGEATDPHDLLFRPENRIRSVMCGGRFC
jgi:cytosine/adenosine deaminase-related metal-dependent hydrolase